MSEPAVKSLYTEEWRNIRSFPEYSVSSEGRVRNNRTRRILAQSLNQQGIPMVGLTRNGEHYKRGVALLVATAFIPRPKGPFDTPINLDGDRENNHVINLMWRPRWFAVFYHKQFKHPPKLRIHQPIIDIKSRIISPNSHICSMTYGLLEHDLVLSIVNRTYVWPTYQRFELFEE
jgi:hypothetical protein